MKQDVKVDILTKEEFDQFYEEELSPVIQELEQKRKSIFNKGALIVSGGIGAIILGLISIMLEVPIAGYLFFAGLLFVAKFLKDLKYDASLLKKEVKDTAVTQLIKQINPSFQYFPHYNQTTEAINEAAFFNPPISFVRGDDLIKGKVMTDDESGTYTEMSFSEISANYFLNKNRTESDQFRGLFYLIDFNKHFDGHVYVLPKDSEIAKVIKPNKKIYEQIELESVSFKEQFDVYATDPILARYILTPRFMERVEQFSAYTKSQEMNSEFEEGNLKTKTKLGWQMGLNVGVGVKGYGVMPLFSFKNGKLFILLPTHREHFEFNVMAPLNKLLFESYYYDLTLALQIVEELNLNLRIWLKE